VKPLLGRGPDTSGVTPRHPSVTPLWQGPGSAALSQPVASNRVELPSLPPSQQAPPGVVQGSPFQTAGRTGGGCGQGGASFTQQHLLPAPGTLQGTEKETPGTNHLCSVQVLQKGGRVGIPQGPASQPWPPPQPSPHPRPAVGECLWVSLTPLLCCTAHGAYLQ
jgi:hypothetical protein